ncbi:adenylate kinase [Metamycoplasma hyosynoviae]|uniref:adenylate kinase n=1 Tax=Metamycoplasma hyosynoviae TaxID=29559 RepID=UPI002359B9A0|nr:adenylate kinase [Metamycoplasma hyosynoviae]MDC8918050.1 adenylate kinase [Metamycoplasma hyosynoviae]
MIDSSKENINLLFLGAPGAGKGSLASKMVEKFGYYQVSTGDMFRREIQNKTELGLKIKSILDSGAFVDDSITNELVQKTLKNLVSENKKFILDGYPRTIEQAKFLKNLEKENIVIHKVILLNITNAQIISRLDKRRICPKCKTIYHMQYNPPKDLVHCDNKTCKDIEIIKRADDAPEIIKKRLDIYEKETAPLIDYYRKSNILCEVNSYKSIEEVLKDAEEVLNW